MKEQIHSGGESDPMGKRIEKLLEPIAIKGVRLKNRMVKPGQGMRYADKEGYMSDRLLAFYEATAKGGVGLITLEVCSVDFPLGMSGAGHLRIDDDRFIPGLGQMAATIHKYQCPVFLQLGHAGHRHPQKFAGAQPVAASSLTADDAPEILDRDYTSPKELTISEIEELVTKFTNGAERARKAGFDGVEVHACHDYLINGFLSLAWNRRQDAYGCQDVMSRSKFLVDIIKAIKERTGRDYPVGVRINGAEYGINRGITPEESRRFSQIIQEAGADYIHVSAYGYGNYTRLIYPEQIFYPEPPHPLAASLEKRNGGAGALVSLAGAVKEVVSLPVITVGRFDAILAEKAIREGKADLVAFGRQLFADPEFPNKVASGRLEEIAPCMACLECRNKVSLNEGIQCRVNAALGREREYAIRPAEKKKKVLVVGGGPAGMEAARVAALRGHEVVLYEKEHDLGGLLSLAGMVRGFDVENLPALAFYLRTQLAKLGVQVRLGSEVKTSVINEIKPDVTILATGGVPATLEIPGMNRENVLSTSTLHKRAKIFLRFLGPRTLRSLTRFWMPFGKRVVVVGGAIQGCELAEFLVKRGRTVTLVETSDKMGAGMVEVNRVRLLRWLTRKGVTLLTEVKYDEITDKGLVIVTKDGTKKTLEADTVALATGLAPNDQLLKTVEGQGTEIHLIGDCEKPGLIIDAIHEGSRIGRSI